MGEQHIHVRRLRADADIVTLTVDGMFSYDELYDAVEESLNLMTHSIAPSALVLNFKRAKCREIGLMSAVFHVGEMVRARVDRCVVVAAPLILQEAIMMIVRVDPELRKQVRLAASLPEALLMLGIGHGTPLLMN
jgi:hypothetical protein